MRPAHQFIGHSAHGGDDHHQPTPAGGLVEDDAGSLADSGGAADGRAAELHDKQRGRGILAHRIHTISAWKSIRNCAGMRLGRPVFRSTHTPRA